MGLAPGDPFNTIPGAAVDALDWVYSTYPNGQNEWAGTVYKGSDGRYYATNPNEGGPTGSSASQPLNLIPAVARYHTHGQCTKNGWEDVFSWGRGFDKWRADM